LLFTGAVILETVGLVSGWFVSHSHMPYQPQERLLGYGPAICIIAGIFLPICIVVLERGRKGPGNVAVQFGSKILIAIAILGVGVFVLGRRLN